MKILVLLPETIALQLFYIWTEWTKWHTSTVPTRT